MLGKKASGGPSIHDLIEQYLDELLNHGIAEGTVRTYRNRLGWFSDWLRDSGTNFRTWKRDDVQRWLTDRREAGLSEKSRRDDRSAVRSFYRWLVERGIARKNPIDETRSIKVPKKLPRILEQHVVARLIAAAAEPRERVILELIYGSAIRRAGLLGITLEDLYLEDLDVVIRNKGGDDVRQPITAAAARAIQTWLPERAALLEKTGRPHLRQLLVTKRGAMCGQTVIDIVKEVAVRAGIDARVYPHLFRHCIATHLLDNGLNLRQVQELLVHSRLETTQVYTHIARKDLKHALQQAHPRQAGLNRPPTPARQVSGGPSFRLLRDK